MHAMMRKGYVLLVGSVFWGTTAIAQAAPETLVTKAAGGQLQPGIAKTWHATADAVMFELNAGNDVQAWATALNERLAGAQATVEQGKLVVKGIPEKTLLEQLVGLPLTGGADPLAELAGLGGGVGAMDAPEGGGSIRASKPTKVAMVGSIQAHNPKERFEADVVGVKHGTFPEVVLTLKMRRPGYANPLRKKFRYGKIIEARVAYNVSSGGVDFSDPHNRRNLVSWYLAKGDRVEVHPVLVGNTIQIDWLVRK